MSTMRKRGFPAPLRIDTPAQNPAIVIAVGNSSASPSTLSSATSESDYSPFHGSVKARSLRNMKKLSLTIPSAQSSSNSLAMSEPPSATNSVHVEVPLAEGFKRVSVVSLPTINPTATLAHRKEEEGSPTVPYLDGPTQIVPGIWLGSEDNARDWKGLVERGIKSILNVAKEVSLPFDAVQPMRPFASTPNLKKAAEEPSTYYPAHLPTGRPSMHYLKLQWSHGQQDLVEDGFPVAMAFTDAALKRGEGVLVHCQCGISRSATMVIALVMRAAAQSSPWVPPEVWALKGMQGAYSYVKEKSKWISPNMSLIYQLLEYEGTLKCDSRSTAPSEESSVVVDEEEEWGRRRREMDEIPPPNVQRESAEIMREAHALDKAMEDRIVARKSSQSSIASSGVGMGVAWRSRYGSRKRTGSIASNTTGGSMPSENLVEEEEEEELLGVGGGFDDGSLRERCSSMEDASASNSPDDDYSAAQRTETLRPQLTVSGLKTPRPPPSAPVWKASFNISPPPATAAQLSFDLPWRSSSTLKGKRRPPAIGILPPVPSSPVSVVTAPIAAAVPLRLRIESRKPAPPPLHLRKALKLPEASLCNRAPASVSTPFQTLFVFPPSPTLLTRTPSTMTVTSNPTGAIPFPGLSTPRVSTFRSHGRTKSFIGLGAPPTPTTACSRVDVRGWVGVE